MEVPAMSSESLASFRAHPLLRLSAAAGILFSLSWIIGLSLWSSSTEVAQSGEEIIRAYLGSERIALAQFFFTEGLPAICLALVMTSFGKYSIAAGEISLGRTILAASWIAASLSFIQFSLGAYLCAVVVPADRPDAAKLAVDVLSRTDGAKMLSMTVFALACFRVLRKGKTDLPAWLSWAAIALAAAIFLSGIGYLFLLNGLSLAAYASLPLLLLWMTGVGIAMGRMQAG
jgi:hypothetical protein